MTRGAKIQPTEYAEWNHEPVVPGAETKEKQTAALKKPEPHKTDPVQKEEKYYQPLKREKAKHEKKESAGLGMVMLGLVLYLMKTDDRKEGVGS